MSWLRGLLDTSGALDARSFARLLLPIGIISPLVGAGLFMIGRIADAPAALGFPVAAWVIAILALLTPASMRRARDIGWSPLLPIVLNALSAVALLGLIEVVSNVGVGVWPFLARDFVGAILWGLLFIAVVGFWSWMVRSLNDRPSKECS